MSTNKNTITLFTNRSFRCYCYRIGEKKHLIYEISMLINQTLLIFLLQQSHFVCFPRMKIGHAQRTHGYTPMILSVIEFSQSKLPIFTSVWILFLPTDFFCLPLVCCHQINLNLYEVEQYHHYIPSCFFKF